MLKDLLYHSNDRIQAPSRSAIGNKNKPVVGSSLRQRVENLVLRMGYILYMKHHAHKKERTEQFNHENLNSILVDATIWGG